MASDAGCPPAGTMATCSPSAPGEWNVTCTSSPMATSRSSAATMTGGVPGVTVKVEEVARWSEGQGVTLRSTGAPASPMTSAAVAFASPSA